MNYLEYFEFVKRINERLKESQWAEIEVAGIGNTITLYCSLDQSLGHFMEIHFRNVNFMKLKTEWRIDDLNDFIIIPNEKTFKEYNKKYQILVGNLMFLLTSEDDEEFIICAETIDFDLVDVKTKLHHDIFNKKE